MSNVVRMISGERRRVFADIVEALSLCRSWPHDEPPVGNPIDKATDYKLALAFRVLVDMVSDRERLRWLERQVWQPDDFPAPHAPVDHFRMALIAWWLDIHEAQQRARSAC